MGCHKGTPGGPQRSWNMIWNYMLWCFSDFQPWQPFDFQHQNLSPARWYHVGLSVCTCLHPSNWCFIMVYPIFCVLFTFFLGNSQTEGIGIWIWRFPKMGVPQNHSCLIILIRFSFMNHPFWGTTNDYGNSHVQFLGPKVHGSPAQMVTQDGESRCYPLVIWAFTIEIYWIWPLNTFELVYPWFSMIFHDVPLICLWNPWCFSSLFIEASLFFVVTEIGVAIS